jgi:hypothetical protein
VNVLCGSSKGCTNSTIDRNMNGITLPSEYDSVRGGPHKPRHSGPGKDDSEMVAVYKSSQTMPEFVITYRAEEDNDGSGGGGGGEGGGGGHSRSTSSSSSSSSAHQCSGCGRGFNSSRRLLQHQRSCSQIGTSAAPAPAASPAGA